MWLLCLECRIKKELTWEVLLHFEEKESKCEGPEKSVLRQLQVLGYVENMG